MNFTIFKIHNFFYKFKHKVTTCSVGNDTFKMYHNTDTDTFSQKYLDTDT